MTFIGSQGGGDYWAEPLNFVVHRHDIHFNLLRSCKNSWEFCIFTITYVCFKIMFWILKSCSFECSRGIASGAPTPGGDIPLSIDRVAYTERALEWVHRRFWWCSHLSAKLGMPPSKPVLKDMYKRKQSMQLIKMYYLLFFKLQPCVSRWILISSFHIYK